MIFKSFKNIQLEAVTGDIANQADVEAVVNAANAQLQTGGGVEGAIHRAAGPELYNECRKLAPIKPGEAVITKAYNLANDYVIHCLGPVYGRDTPEDKLLTNYYKNALRLAEKHQIRSIACPDSYREGGAKSLTAMSGFLVFCIDEVLFNREELTERIKYLSTTDSKKY